MYWEPNSTHVLLGVTCSLHFVRPWTKEKMMQLQRTKAACVMGPEGLGAADFRCHLGLQNESVIYLQMCIYYILCPSKLVGKIEEWNLVN